MVRIFHSFTIFFYFTTEKTQGQTLNEGSGNETRGSPIKGRVPVKYASLSLGISRDKSREKIPLPAKIPLFCLALSPAPAQFRFHPFSHPVLLIFLVLVTH
jgi:hypothetical protein